MKDAIEISNNEHKNTTQFQPTYLSSIFIAFHINKCKSTWSASLVIINNLNVLNGTERFKKITQFSLLCIQTESKYTETSTLTRIALQQMIKARNHQQVQHFITSASTTSDHECETTMALLQFFFFTYCSSNVPDNTGNGTKNCIKLLLHCVTWSHHNI